MYKRLLALPLLLVSVGINAQVKRVPVKHTPSKTLIHNEKKPLHLANYEDTVSYAIGVSLAKFYKMQGAKKLNTSLLSSAVNSVFHGDSTILTDEQVGDILMQAGQKYASEKAEIAKKEGADFLAKNKSLSGVVSLPDGLQYKILQQGHGAIPTDTNSVKVNYKGALINGTEFDNSYKRGAPLDIEVSHVIKGWTEVLQKMPVGSIWRVWIPSDLGYGDHGAGETIPPGSTLVFDIELLGINK